MKKKLEVQRAATHLCSGRMTQLSEALTECGHLGKETRDYITSCGGHRVSILHSTKSLQFFIVQLEKQKQILNYVALVVCT